MNASQNVLAALAARTLLSGCPALQATTTSAGDTPPVRSEAANGLAYSTASANVVQPMPAPGCCHYLGSGLFAQPDPQRPPGRSTQTSPRPISADGLTTRRLQRIRAPARDRHRTAEARADGCIRQQPATVIYIELHAFATRLGLKREWFQSRPDRLELHHYDLILGKREQALRLGYPSGSALHARPAHGVMCEYDDRTSTTSWPRPPRAGR